MSVDPRLPSAAGNGEPVRGVGRRRADRAPWAAVLIVTALSIRLGLWLLVSQNPPLAIQGDGRGYEQIARNVLGGHGFTSRREPPYAPDMFRTPGYPLFVAGVYWLGGHRPEIVTLLQNVLGLATLCFGYLLARQLFGGKAARIAAALMAFDVGLIILANVTLTETLFLFLFVPASYCLLRGLVAPRRWVWPLTAGVLFGLATLVRPAATYLPILLLPLVWWMADASWRSRTGLVALLSAAWMAPLVPWMVRDARVFGSPSFALPLRAITLNVHASYLRAALDGTSLAEEVGKIRGEVEREVGSGHERAVQRYRRIAARASEEIREHPAEYAALYLKGMALTAVLPNTNYLANSLGMLDRSTGIIAEMRNRSPAESVQALSELYASHLAGAPRRAVLLVALLAETLLLPVVYALAAIAVVGGWRRGHRDAILFLLAFIAYFFVAAGPIGTGRYRAPAMPYLMILAGYGAAALASPLRER